MSYKKQPVVSILMGSESDRDIMKGATEVLEKFKIAYEWNVISAHRLPELLHQFIVDAEKRGVEVIIAGAGGAAHLPGVIAAFTPLPVIGVPVDNSSLDGMDSLLSIVQMPAGIPVGTMAIGKAGARNAGFYALSILGGKFPELRQALKAYRLENRAELQQKQQSSSVVYIPE